MLILRSLVFNILLFGLIPVIGILGAPYALISRSGAFWAIDTFCSIALWLLEKICGLRVEVRGTVPRGKVLVASKHQSFLDIIVHSRVLPRPRYVMKKELKWAPFVGLYATRMGCIMVDRGKGSSTMAAMLEKENKENQDPGQLVIYPQGTRTAPHAVVRYKSGAGVLYGRFGKTCVPAATNVGLFWGRNSFIRRPGVAVVQYLDPIPPGLPIPEFMTLLEERIETATDALLAEAGAPRPEPGASEA